MAHVRKTIRDNIVTACTSLSTTGSNVFRTRVYPLAAGNLPGLCIYTTNEDTALDTLSATRNVERLLDVNIEAWVRATTNYDNTLDTICKEIEVAMAADSTRGGNAKDSFLIRTEFDYSEDGDRPVATARLTYSVIYRTAINNPETAT